MYPRVHEAPESAAPPKPVEQLAVELAELYPKPVTYFTPDNLKEVTADFLSGRRRLPDNATYSQLDDIDFDKKESDYRAKLAEILAHPGIPAKHHRVYESFVGRAIDINSLMRAAVAYRTAESGEEKAAAKQSFEALNKRLYGETNVQTAASMVREVLDDTQNAPDAAILKIRGEFEELTSKMLPPAANALERLKPSRESKELVGRIVQELYSPLLRHADELIARMTAEEGAAEDKLKLGPQAVAVIFQTIIDREFPGSGWKVVIKPAKAINVLAATKTVTVPEARPGSAPNKVRGLVVHELGVHMLRSIIGEGADLIPLRFGLDGFGAAEDGIAKVMESAVTGEEERTGYQHYLTASLLGQGYDFRETFEVMWRYKALDAYLKKPGSEIDESFIESQQATAAKFMLRSIGGTNQLPWHDNLVYFVGTNKAWRYIETHKDDPDLATLLFMGRIDPTNIDHLKAALDANGRIDQ